MSREQALAIARSYGMTANAVNFLEELGVLTFAQSTEKDIIRGALEKNLPSVPYDLVDKILGDLASHDYCIEKRVFSKTCD